MPRRHIASARRAHNPSWTVHNTLGKGMDSRTSQEWNSPKPRMYRLPGEASVRLLQTSGRQGRFATPRGDPRCNDRQTSTTYATASRRTTTASSGHTVGTGSRHLRRPRPESPDQSADAVTQRGWCTGAAPLSPRFSLGAKTLSERSLPCGHIVSTDRAHGPSLTVRNALGAGMDS